MLKLKGNSIVRFFLLLCVAMQVVVTTPHHHHPGRNGAICFNIFHSYDEIVAECREACEEKCGGHHDHTPDEACPVRQFVVANPEREQTEIVPSQRSTDKGETSVSKMQPTECPLHESGELKAATELQRWRRSEAEPLRTHRIPVTRLARAPDLTA